MLYDEFDCMIAFKETFILISSVVNQNNNNELIKKDSFHSFTVSVYLYSSAKWEK